MAGYWTATGVALLLLFSTSALAGDIYKCPNPTTGKVEFRDRPCEAKGEKFDVKPNSVGTMEPGEASKKLQDLNKKIADRNKAEDEQRARDGAANAQFFEVCRGHAEEIYRQQPLTVSLSYAVRESAVRSIAVERKRLADAGCPPVNVRALVDSR